MSVLALGYGVRGYARTVLSAHSAPAVAGGSGVWQTRPGKRRMSVKNSVSKNSFDATLSEKQKLHNQTLTFPPSLLLSVCACF